MLTHRIGRITQLLLIPLLIGAIGCQNHNLFSKLHGDSSNPTTLTQEAAIALQNKDFSKAVELANRVLDNDPNNSDALYYRAQGKLGLAGLNLGIIVSNVLGQVGSSSLAVSNLGDLIQRARDGVHAEDACGGATSIVAGLDCASLESVMSGVLSDLNLIVRGGTHGNIQQFDTALSFDLGLLDALDAALIAVSHNYMDVTNTNGTFGVTPGTNLNALCTSNQQDALTIVELVALSYSSFDGIIRRGSAKSTSIVSDIRDDVNIVGQKILTKGSGQILPQACFDNVFDAHNPPITKDNYTSTAI